MTFMNLDKCVTRFLFVCTGRFDSPNIEQSVSGISLLIETELDASGIVSIEGKIVSNRFDATVGSCGITK